jgi:hypothetical protein
MVDVRELLKIVDRVPTPDLSAEVWRRVAEPTERSLGVQVRRAPRTLAVAASILLLVAGAAWALRSMSDAGRPTDGVAADADAGWLTDPTATSCIEPFSIGTLSSRSWAFAGVITAVEPPGDLESGAPEDLVTSVTFRVERWYKGGSSGTTTFLTYSTPGGQSSDGRSDASIGARLLVSGEDRYIWGCGFTRPYTDENLALFEEAFPA